MTWKEKVGQTAGCLFAFVVFSAMALFLFPSCSDPERWAHVPHVDDPAGLLSPAAEGSIRAVSFPVDIVVVVKTVSRIDPADVAASGYRELEGHERWGRARPRTWYRHYFKADPSWSTGVFVLVSREPRLIQIRFGERIRLEAFRSGLAYGPEYRGRQEGYRTGSEDSVVATIRWLGHRLPQALQLPWYLRWSKRVVVLSFSEFEEFLAPGGALYSDTLLKAVVGGLARLGVTGSVWLFPLTLFACFGLVWLLLKKAIVDQLIGLRFGAMVHIALSIAVSVVLSVSLLASSFASLLVLGNGREEDRLLLQHLGLGAQVVGFNSDYFLRETGLILATITGVIAFFVENVEANIESSPSRSESTLALGCIGWTAFVLFVPRAVAVFVILTLIARMFGVAIGHASQEGAVGDEA